MLWGENLTWKLLHKLLHHTDCTVQLIIPQPESSRAEDRWRGGKKRQNRREGERGRGGKTRKRKREDIGGMKKGEIYNNSRLSPSSFGFVLKQKSQTQNKVKGKTTKKGGKNPLWPVGGGSQSLQSLPAMLKAFHNPRLGNRTDEERCLPCQSRCT